jgi:myo-inositol-1(or 4)-monophosphatase
VQWPEHDLIGEEGSRRETGSDFCWYIDPPDGTTNFAHGYPVFCVSMALEYHGVGESPALSMILPAMRCLRGQKAADRFLNGRPTHVSGIARLKESLWPPVFPATNGTRTPTSTSITRSRCAPTECAAPDLPRSTSPLSGVGPLVTRIGNSISIPGITAAGVLLVEEAAQGYNFTGGPFNIDSREVLGSNSFLHDELLKEFQAIISGRVEGLPSVAEYFPSKP